MSALIPFPNISPEIVSFSIFGLYIALRWYALAYIVGILIAWRVSLVAIRRAPLWRNDTPPMTRDQLEDLLTWVILGIIFGGRLGFVLFYQPAYYLQNPMEIPMVWTGGMSFHGGFLGVIIAALIFTARHNIPRPAAADAIALGVPWGLMLGRLANFIKPELWGRPTTAPWGVAFPGAAAQDCPDVIGICARHPSQLYEAALEGVVLGIALLWLAHRRGALKYPGLITGVFIAGYGLSRFIVEFFRQADDQFITAQNPMGFVISLGDFGVTMGQVLSLPMLIIGIGFIIAARRRSHDGPAHE